MRIVAIALSLLMAKAAVAEPLTLASPDFTPGARLALAQVYDKGGCNGGNHSPALVWTGAPAGTKSFALLVNDSDAPGGFWHWALIDIPASVSALAEGAAAPNGARTLVNDFGDFGYSGPCPPSGAGPHHYHFVLYALDVAKLGGVTNAAQAFAAVGRHRLASAERVGVWGH